MAVTGTRGINMTSRHNTVPPDHFQDYTKQDSGQKKRKHIKPGFTGKRAFWNTGSCPV
jgi:hypothetical protein